MVLQHVVFHCNNNKYLYTQTKDAHEYVNSNYIYLKIAHISVHNIWFIVFLWTLHLSL